MVITRGAASAKGFGWSAKTGPVIGQQAYTSAGTYSWTAPAGITSVSVVAVGSVAPPGTNSFGGAGLGYVNNYSVTPGSSYTVSVGASGNNSYFVSTAVVKGGGVTALPSGGTYAGTGGGSGGTGAAYDPANYIPGSGGAGGYSGSGGDGGVDSGGTGVNGLPGTGGGGGGGAAQGGTGPGGGVGILGQGANGAGGTIAHQAGYGGSGGADGSSSDGGAYGGGNNWGGTGGGGAVRIIWPGTTRSFPSTNTADM